MGLADRFTSVEAKSTPSAEVTCTRYEAVPGTRRCKHYLKGGACSLPDEFMCVEWLKANGHHVPPPPTGQSPPRAAWWNASAGVGTPRERLPRSHKRSVCSDS